MVTNPLEGWPRNSAVKIFRYANGNFEVHYESGDVRIERPWASVSKAVAAIAIAVEIERGRVDLDEDIGQNGATLAQALSHAGGFGFEQNDEVIPPGQQRIYSNFGIDLACQFVSKDKNIEDWLSDNVLTPLGMQSILEGKPSAGIIGSLDDMAIIAREWLRPTLMSETLGKRFSSVFAPGLSGFVPGFGKFTPCPWGLGLEIHGKKCHWMNGWPEQAFGHFGQSGTLLLMDRNSGFGVVAAAGEPFGQWARVLWPQWSKRIWTEIGVT